MFVVLVAPANKYCSERRYLPMLAASPTITIEMQGMVEEVDRLQEMVNVHTIVGVERAVVMKSGKVVVAHVIGEMQKMKLDGTKVQNPLIKPINQLTTAKPRMMMRN